jgi:ethanolamine ammonia-lyase small subunit
MSDQQPPATPPARPDHLSPADLTGLIRAIRERTPARILVGRAGPAYLTKTQLELRRDHAAALDAVHAELVLARDFSPEFVRHSGLFEVETRATSKLQYLMRPDLGRRLSDKGWIEIENHCSRGADVQVVIGDGLSAAAVVAQVPPLLPVLEQEVRNRGWTWGRPFVIRYCRVGILNEVGAVLRAQVVVLLIGERPGLATAESLSAYLAYQPRPGDTDARRNLISNIHGQGLPPPMAAGRIVALAEKMRFSQKSGVEVKERSL